MLLGEEFFRKLNTCDKYHVNGLIDHNGYVQLVSDNYTEVTGYTPDDIIGTRLLERIHPLDHEYIHQQHHIMISTRKPVRTTFERLQKDGSYKSFTALVTPIFDGDTFMGCFLESELKELNMITIRESRIA